MGEQDLIRHVLRFAMRETAPGSPRAAAIVAWCKDNAAYVGLPEPADEPRRRKIGKGRKHRGKKGKPSDWERLRAALEMPPAGAPDDSSAPLSVARRLGALLSLPSQDTRLLETAVAFNRLPQSSRLVRMLRQNGIDPIFLAADMGGFDSPDALARSTVVRIGLIELEATRDGGVTVELSDALYRALRRGPLDDEQLIGSLVGIPTSTALTLDDFTDHAEAAALVRRVLVGAMADRAAGVNILLHGPPGVGKTEFAKAVAAAAGAALFAVGEADEDGDEPSRWERVTALKLAQRMLARREKTVLLFDEMEDFIGDVEVSNRGGFYSRREGSKVFVNRLLETNAVPIIWTSNAIENIDPAFLRRMSFVQKMGIPSKAARKRIFSRIAEREGIVLSPAAVDRFSGTVPEAVTVAHSALRAAHLADGDETVAGVLVDSLVSGLHHGRKPGNSARVDQGIDLDLYEAESPIGDLIGRLSRPGAPVDFTLLLTGPPGTGKTALAHHLARALGRPLVVKRVSDLVSKWIGETEEQIADAFRDAARDGHVLLFDEIDSLLFDRSVAMRSWEVSQVNELLTQMDDHPMPFLAATNHQDRLDPAAMRRFDFKLALEPLGTAKAARAFRRFFGAAPPARLREVAGLTPGDFALVARQLRFEDAPPTAEAIVDRLAREAESKPNPSRHVGIIPGAR